MNAAVKRARVLLAAVPVAVAACAARGGQPAPVAEAPCVPVDAVALAGTPWDSLAGEWRLTLVATRGPMAGRSVWGILSLRPQEPGLRRMDRPGPNLVTVPLVGTSDIRLEEVAAVRMGNLGSSDPSRPGASVWVSQGADGIVSGVLRLGQEEIGSRLQPFDAGYTALYLRRVGVSGIYGGWASGTPEEVAAGHFCAVRATR